MDFLQRLALASPIVYGSVANASVKQCAERTQALEAAFQANVRDAQAADAEQLFGLLNSALNQVLARRSVERLTKRSQEMVTRKAGLFGNFREIERTVITFVHKPSRAPQPFTKVIIGDRRIYVFFSHRSSAARVR